MSLVTTNLLADALFARKLIKTVRTKTFDEEAERLLNLALDQMNNARGGRLETQNYKSSSKDALTLLKAYGTVISVVKAQKQFEGEDCVEKYIKSIQNELTYALKNKTVDPKALKHTLQYYEQVINFVIDEDTTYNSAESPESYWQPTIKH